MSYSKEKSHELYTTLLDRGIHDGLAREIAFKYMNTEYTATRMLGYLYGHQELSEELIVDEMLAILEDRERFMKKHEAQEANAAITRMYRDGL